MSRKHKIQYFALFAVFVCLGCFIESAMCGWYQRRRGRRIASELPYMEQSREDGDFSPFSTLGFWAPFIVVALAAIGLSAVVVYFNPRKKRLS